MLSPGTRATERAFDADSLADSRHARNLSIFKMAEGRKKKRRKKRDSTFSLKPPLDFIESPVEGRKYYCTPVQCARRPFLAPSLPVDDQTSAKWLSPQFLRYMEEKEGESLLNPVGTRKKLKSRNQRRGNVQNDPSSNTQMLVALEFRIGKKNSRKREMNSNNQRPCRRSQRIQQKELKKADFLFQSSLMTTPVNRGAEKVLAQETPDQELFMATKLRQLRSYTGNVT